MNIGDASERSGLPAKTIRYYEDIRLLKPARSDNGYRDYSSADVHRLRFLQRARGLGFSVEECRQLLSLYGDKAARERRREGDRRGQARGDRPQGRRAARAAEDARASGPQLPWRRPARLPDPRRAVGRHPMSASGICVVTAGGPYPWIIINALGKKFGPIDVLSEEPGIAAGFPEAPRPQDRLVRDRRAVRHHGAGAAGQEASCREDRRHRCGRTGSSRSRSRSTRSSRSAR